MPDYNSLIDQLRSHPLRWLVTGAAGFIGSHLVDHLLGIGQTVVAVDNLATGHMSNLSEAACGQHKERFIFMKGDISDPFLCEEACDAVDVVLHQAGLGSVPRSLDRPLDTHQANVTATLSLMAAAQRAGVRRFVFASSSSVYGDDQTLPKTECRIGSPLSPYAASKAMCEIYAKVFYRNFGLSTIGLRYFNVFGPRQDPAGPYAAVIPRWLAAIGKGSPVQINGDGSTSRDFCYVANVVQANLLAGARLSAEAEGLVFNIACGDSTSLNELYSKIRNLMMHEGGSTSNVEPVYHPRRDGDILHSRADISLAQRLLGYQPSHDIDLGLAETIRWQLRQWSSPGSPMAA